MLKYSLLKKNSELHKSVCNTGRSGLPLGRLAAPASSWLLNPNNSDSALHVPPQGLLLAECPSITLWWIQRSLETQFNEMCRRC